MKSGTTRTNRRLLYSQANQLIEGADRPNYAETVGIALSAIYVFDQIHISLNSLDQPPIELYSPKKTKAYTEVMGLWLAGAYALDPFFEYWQKQPGSWVLTLGEVIPDGFTRTKYYSMFYSALNLIDELYASIKIDDRRWVAISIGRLSGGKFSRTRSARVDMQDQLKLLENGFRFNRRFFPELYGDSDDRPAEKRFLVENAFERFGAHRLTPREREVTWLMLKGHSSKSIAVELGLSPGTVKVHRKNIYAELGCKSLSGLFSLFLAQLQSEG